LEQAGDACGGDESDAAADDAEAIGSDDEVAAAF
jgi:hypothetical protein